MTIPLAPPAFFRLAACVYAFILVCSVVSFTHPRLRGPRAKAIRQAINSWWPPALLGGVAMSCGRWTAWLVFAGVAAWVLREYIRALPSEERNVTLEWWVYGTLLVHYAAIASGHPEWIWLGWLAWAFGVLTLVSIYVGGPRPITRVARYQLGAVWAVFCLGYVPLLVSQGPAVGPLGTIGLASFLLICVMVNDASQYVFGKALGRHPLAPVLSPKKTWEGLVGGMATTALVAAIVGPAALGTARSGAAAAGFALAGIGTVGDLMVSGFKREVGVKDSGQALPGQGGVLDRCDSLLLTAPLFFYAVRAWLT